MSNTATTLSPARIRSYVNVHIPLRIHYLQACMSAVRLVMAGADRKGSALTLPGYVTVPEGVRLFCELAIDAGLIYSRVLLSFLGIYRKGQTHGLTSRAPVSRYQQNEVWIEKFPGGVLLPLNEFLTILPRGINAQKMHWHVLRALHMSSTETAHLTNTLFGQLRANRLRLDSLYYTCWLVRKHIFRHFYRDTVAKPVPDFLLAFDNTNWSEPEA